MTTLRNIFRKGSAATLAFALIPIVGVLTVHKILKIVLSFCIHRQCDIFRDIDGWTVTRQRLVLGTIVYIPLPSVCCVRGHFLVKWPAFVIAVCYECHCDSKPFALDFNCKGCAVIPLMPVGEVAKCF